MYDNGEPAYKATQRVRVTVIRNRSGPLFAVSPIYRMIHETFAVGGYLATANATDLDGVSTVLISFFIK